MYKSTAENGEKKSINMYSERNLLRTHQLSALLAYFNTYTRTHTHNYYFPWDAHSDFHLFKTVMNGLHTKQFVSIQPVMAEVACSFGISLQVKFFHLHKFLLSLSAASTHKHAHDI
jgi:hypothetical protein